MKKIYSNKLIKLSELTNIKRIQSFQSKVLRKIVNSPFYVPNRVLHKDLNVPIVNFCDSINLCSNMFHQVLSPKSFS